MPPANVFDLLALCWPTTLAGSFMLVCYRCCYYGNSRYADWS